MIVNSAYMYMGKPALQPVIFSGQTVNYKYENKSGCDFVSSGIKFSSKGNIDFLELDCTKFTTITFSVNNQYQFGQSLDVKLIDSAGNMSSQSDLLISGSSTQSKTYTIPEAFRKSHIKLRLSTAITTYITAISAVLS